MDSDEVVPETGAHGPGRRHRTGLDPTGPPLWMVRTRTGHAPAGVRPRSAADRSARFGGVDSHIR